MFGMYLAPSVIERMLAAGDLPELGGERRDMTLLFSDIANFTTLTEATDPAVMLPALNAYLDGISEVVMQHGGLVMDMAGDGMMALFGAPANQPDHAARAVACAREMFEFTERFRHQQAVKGLRFGHTRIGLNSGEAAVGNFGSSKRLKYTAMGDVVNVASRLEGLNKYVDSRVCMSDATRVASGDTQTRPMGRFRLKGKVQGILVHEVLSPERSGRPFMAHYRDAFAALERGDAGVLERFEALHAEDPEDGCVLFYLHRLRDGVVGSEVVMEDK
jgi:adenylate cyclase